MSKITTADCKKFLVEFFSRNPGIIRALFGGDAQAVADAQIEVTDIQNWVREYRCKPGSDASRVDGEYVVFNDGQPVNRYAEGHRYMDANEVALERGFFTKGSEGQIGFIVIEDKNGELHLADYIGD